MQTNRYWIWLSQLNISPRARACVVQLFGDAETAFLSKPGSFSGRAGISAREAAQLELRDLTDVDRTLACCRAQDLRVLPITDPSYPDCLRQLFDPPAVLFVRGTLPPVDEIPVLAVIGTRRASPYGIKMGGELAARLAADGAVVLSLLTQGHEVCRLSLVREVAQTGAVISEYPPGRVSMRHFFRERNRIAAGLSDGVVVVEAPEKSGTRLFVTEAVEQGKDVFAVPGNADSENAAGTLSLIKEGAKLVTDAEDVLEEYRGRYPLFFSEKDTLPPQESRPAQRKQPAAPNKPAAPPTPAPPPDPVNLTDDQRRILDAIGAYSAHVDDITEQTGLPMARVLSQLTILEIRGLVRHEAGKRFARTEIHTK